VSAELNWEWRHAYQDSPESGAAPPTVPAPGAIRNRLVGTNPTRLPGVRPLEAPQDQTRSRRSAAARGV